MEIKYIFLLWKKYYRTELLIFSAMDKFSKKL